MDPATAALLIRLGGELGSMLIGTLRAAGRNEEADQIQAILSRSDANFNVVVDWSER